MTPWASDLRESACPRRCDHVKKPAHAPNASNAQRMSEMAKECVNADIFKKSIGSAAIMAAAAPELKMNGKTTVNKMIARANSERVLCIWQTWPTTDNADMTPRIFSMAIISRQ